MPGNHEQHANYTHYKERYNMPINDANKGTSKFYSFNLGPAHYIVLDTDIYLHEEYQDAALT